MGFLPVENRIAKAFSSLKVTEPRSIPIDPSIPMAAQVALPSLKVTGYSYRAAYSYRLPSVPMAAQVALPGLQVTRYSYSCPGIPMAAQVALPGLPVTRYSYKCPNVSMVAVWGRRRYNLYFNCRSTVLAAATLCKKTF